MFRKKAKETKLEKIWLSDRWFIDIRSKPYLLFDSKGMILNGHSHPLGHCCTHALGTDGLCNDCWNKLFDEGLKAIKCKR